MTSISEFYFSEHFYDILRYELESEPLEGNLYREITDVHIIIDIIIDAKSFVFLSLPQYYCAATCGHFARTRPRFSGLPRGSKTSEILVALPLPPEWFSA